MYEKLFSHILCNQIIYEQMAHIWPLIAFIYANKNNHVYSKMSISSSWYFIHEMPVFLPRRMKPHTWQSVPYMFLWFNIWNKEAYMECGLRLFAIACGLIYGKAFHIRNKHLYMLCGCHIWLKIIIKIYLFYTAKTGVGR